jgi:hypothetical protein
MSWHAAVISIFWGFQLSLASILYELAFDGMIVIQNSPTSALDRRNVHKHILVSAGLRDEAVALRWIEPFHGTFSQWSDEKSVGTAIPGPRGVWLHHRKRRLGHWISGRRA